MTPHSADRAKAALRGGTLPYMAPEQLRAFLDPDGWDRVGAAADVYALGLLLRELLTGRRPSGHDPSVPLPRAIQDLLDAREGGFGPARAINPDVPRTLDAVIARCLAGRPEDRYPGAGALAEDLGRFVAHLPLLHAANPSLRERLRNWRLRRGGRVAMIASGIGVAAALAALSRPSGAAPRGAGELVTSAIARLGAGDLPGAEGEALSALAADPRSPSALGVLADIHGRMGRPGEALTEIDRAIALSDVQGARLSKQDVALLHHKKGDVLLRAGRVGEAASAYGSALAIFPMQVASRAALAKIAEDGHDYRLAIVHLNRAIASAEQMGQLVDSRLLLELIRRLAVAECNVGNSECRTLDLAGFRRARPSFEAAWANIARARGLVTAATPAGDLNNLDFAEAMVRVALGGLASAEDDYGASVGQYRPASALLDKLIARGFDGDAVKRLRAEAKKRLQGDLARLGPL